MEKEKYEVTFDGLIYDIFDNEMNQQITYLPLKEHYKVICSLLNQQDARIKELENLLNSSAKIKTNTFNSIQRLKQENQQLKKQIEKERALTMDLYLKALDQIKDLQEENQRLKEQYDKLNKKYCEEMDKNIALKEEIKQLKENLTYEKNFWRENNKILKQLQNENVIEVLKNLRDYFAIKDTNLNAYDIVADYGDILDWISDKIKELG